MIEKYNLENFRNYIAYHNNDEDIFQYFVRMNKDYKKEKKAGNITEDTMMHLVEFWNSLADAFEGSLTEFLYTKWEGRRPVMVEDIVNFAPKYNQIRCEKYMTKLDPTETEETESLFKAIWDKNMRFEGTYSFYDWDEDTFDDQSIEVPRKNRDAYMYDFKRICASVIYNRGNMLLKFYARRGGYEIVAVHVGDGRGIWECLSKAEIQESYTTNEGYPMSFEDNETVVFLEKEEKEDKEDEKILYFQRHQG